MTSLIDKRLRLERRKVWPLQADWHLLGEGPALPLKNYHRPWALASLFQNLNHSGRVLSQSWALPVIPAHKHCGPVYGAYAESMLHVGLTPWSNLRLVPWEPGPFGGKPPPGPVVFPRPPRWLIPWVHIRSDLRLAPAACPRAFFAGGSWSPIPSLCTSRRV